MTAILDVGRPSPPAQRDTHDQGTAPLLDMLRFTAAALVMLNHLRVNQFMPYGDVEAARPLLKQLFFAATRLGLEAVLLFFVLSGFLVGGASVSKFRSGTFDPARYAVDRLSRIYVPFVPALVLTVAKCLWLEQPFSWSEAGVNLVSLQGVLAPAFSGNTALWSLSYEVWFYIACGALLAALKLPNGRTRFACLGMLAATLAVFAVLEVAYLASWVIGAVAYAAGTRRRHALLFAGLLIVPCGILLMQLTSISRQVDLAAFTWIDRSLAIVVLSMGLACVVAVCAAVKIQSRGMARFAKVSAFLSSFSYTLYLMHNPMIDVLHHMGLLRRLDRLDGAAVATYLGNAAIILAASFALYWLFERRTPIVRRHLLGRLVGSRAIGQARVQRQEQC